MERTALPVDIQAILKNIPYATMATVCADDAPWNTPVVARFDDQLRMYWVSSKNSQHSVNITLDPRIFVVVYDSRAPEGQGAGLYLGMRARVLASRDDIARAATIYDTSFFTHDSAHEQFLGSCPQRIYEAVPQRMWRNDETYAAGHFIDVRHDVM